MPSSEMVQKHLPLFELLVQSTDDQRTVLIQTLSEPQLRAVLEAIYNVLKGNCPVRNQEKTSLHQFRGVIGRLVSKELSRKQQQRLLKKHRNLLPIVLNPAIRFLKHHEH